MDMPSTRSPLRFLGWAIGLSPLLAIAILMGLPVVGINCRVTEAAATPCYVLGSDIGSLLSVVGLFAAWGWIVSVPAGVVSDLLVRQFSGADLFLAQTGTMTADVASSPTSTARLCTSCGF